MLLYAVFTLLLLLLLYLLFLPINLVIDTANDQYYVAFKGLAKVQLQGHPKKILCIRLRAFFMNFYFYPLQRQKASKKLELQKTAIRQKKKRRISFSKLIRLIRSFKVKRLLVELDTADVITNAKLYPVFAFLNHHLGTFRINFEGRNRLALHLQNRPINIIKSFINY